MGVVKGIQQELDDATTLIELGEAEGDEASVAEGEKLIRALQPAAEELGLPA